MIALPITLWARAYDKILRVAHTIADLDASAEIGPAHLNEAINDRMLDRHLWMGRLGGRGARGDG